MTDFSRKFAIEKITDAVLERNGWLQDMICGWKPPGDELLSGRVAKPGSSPAVEAEHESTKHLRLAVRNGYCNLYRGGQSVAKLSFGRDGEIQAKIHQRYVDGQSRDQTYLTLTSKGVRHSKDGRLQEYAGIGDLETWIAHANQKVGKEKAFVDRVIAHNPNAIDMEMALPAAVEAETKVAVRMDLVTLEPSGDGWKVVFWEAKRSDDQRIRCQAGDKPHVMTHQIEPYISWLRWKGNMELVARAYQDTCKVLLEFHRLAKRINPAIGNLGPGIVAVAQSDAQLPLVDNKPRVLIDDRERSASLGSHVIRLQKELGVPVQVVASREDMVLEEGR